MADDLQVSWELSGSGWARFRIADSTAERTDVVSYCTDALADLLGGVAGLYGPSTDQQVSFDLEPAEVRWRLRCRGTNLVITVYRFPDLNSSWDAPDEEGTLVWSSTQPRPVFTHAVMEAAQAVLELHGEVGYREKWIQHSFPVAALQDLRRLHLRDDECWHEQCQGSPDS
ncbi:MULTISPECIES: hypothetical protein [unclassified Streptomyces]|uniref:hypothetical protein n=1 Tax=unclassified Streptomyces TaxID=2593676 RepID=UPI002DDB7AAD|nr:MULTISPECIES: hypothetical protein [unclassified Streptomyces]WSF83681.1 hypothetical protein OIE70_11710 [Streptomyces sp. NBC_01744]WSC48205.1 hypothetical protein OIE61_31895 [Streptomyces sp. NBC_01762]WSC52834.1 hypothetical protein OG808_11605 [Streptomyces sp. NBC_01761]WSD27854.1 hypothetical protein OHA26_32610 [Streptomyces sp. NBC_01751]WSJ50185.1 hypothetical protein OG243_12030 [Streptomyces sp. NBC_01318]